jgi:hypothetical protein
MKKFSLLLGTLGGALAGYVLTNDKLRQDLMKAKDPEAAAKLLGAHLSKDGKKIAGEVKTFVESDDVQNNLKKAKTFAVKKLDEAKKSMSKMMKKGGKAASGVMKDAMGTKKKSTKKAS